MGLTALVPMVLLMGGKVLKKADLFTFPWDVVFLAMGGLVLGKAVSETRLLDAFVAEIKPVMTDMHLVVVFGFLMIVVVVSATFVSHTVAAMVLVPVAREVGRGLGRPNTFVMGTALMCSGAMALQISGFPNMIASNKMDGLGRRYAEKGHFFHLGTVSTLICLLVVSLAGFYMMLGLLDKESISQE